MRRLVLILVAGLVLATVPVVVAPAGSQTPTPPEPSPGAVAVDGAPIPGAGTARPRILLWPETIDDVRSRVTRAPYDQLWASLLADAAGAPAPDPAHRPDCQKKVNEGREVAKAGAARTLAFAYVLDPVGHAADADRVRDWLLTMCLTSRIKVDPDRDLGTSHELLGYASAYDLLAGGGYVFDPVDEAEIVANLVTLADDFLADYEGFLGTFLVNNHGWKGASSLGIAAIVLAERPEARDWLDRAVDFSDELFRHTYGPGDGAYGESPHYLKYGMQNAFSFLQAWNRANGGASWTTQDGLTLPDLWTHPAFTTSARWLLDMTLPDGTFAPIDDGNGGESAFWGAYPADFPDAPALWWRWLALADQNYGGSVDNRLDTLVAFDDGVAVAPPDGSPTAFYQEGGSAVFRSGWDADATLAIVQGEHGAARELGRTREGRGQAWSAPHDHADPGSIQLHAHGEPLLVDGGYLNYPWTLQWVVNKPSDHNMVLVGPPSDDGRQESPADPLTYSTQPLWGAANPDPFFTTPGAPSSIDGDAQIFDTLDSAAVDAASVVSSYGSPAAVVQRRTAFVDDRFLVVADTGRSDTHRTWTWPLHGNAGGATGTWDGAAALSASERPPAGAAALDPAPKVAAGGSFEQTATGGVWIRPSGTRLSAGMAFDVTGRAAVALPSLHEADYKQLTEHTALRTSVGATDVHGLQLLYPSPAGQATPTISEIAVPGAAALRLDAADADERVVAVHRSGGGPLTVPAAASGVAEIETDADLLVVTASSAGEVRSVWAEGATHVDVGGETWLASDDPGTLGLSLGADRAEVVADVADPEVEVGGLPFVPQAVEGACGLDTSGTTVAVSTARDPRFALAAAAIDGRPAADPGPQRRVAVGAAVGLDGSGSCDPDGGGLAHRWRLVSAAAGSAWSLTGADGPTPTLLADRPGIYRVEHTVTDAAGNESLPVEVEILAGPPSSDTVDNDLDGTFDGADPDGDTGGTRFVPIAPTRVVDTRTGTGTPAGRFGAGEVREVALAGGATGVPDEAVAVVVNATGVGPSAASHLTLWPAGSSRPRASSLNLAPGRTVANLVSTALGDGGRVGVFNNAGTVDVVADVVGYFVRDPGAAGYAAAPAPTRVLDSRTGVGTTGGAWTGGESRTVRVIGGATGVPDDAVAVVVNTTAVMPGADTHLTVWPAGTDRPHASSLNAGAGRTVANLVTVGVGDDGSVSVFNNAGDTDVVMDVVGWYVRGADGAELASAVPTRIVDTRTGLGGSSAALGAKQQRTVAVVGAGSPVPSGARAAILNVTAVGATAATHLTVWPGGLTRPTASSLNLGAGETVPNLVVAGIGPGGTVEVFNNAGTTHLVVDVVGWYT